MDREYIAHINDETKQVQTIKEHSENTAKLCREFSVPELSSFMYVLGMLHDCGKYQSSFQRRINGENISVEHSVCGALIAKERYSGAIAYMLEYCIAGHHSGIPDGGFSNDTLDKPTLHGRMQRRFEDFSAYKEEISVSDIDAETFNQFMLRDTNGSAEMLIDKFAFLTRYSFSCLADADSLDTARFCNQELPRRLISDFNRCLEKVNIKLGSFECKTKLQKSRAVIQQQVFSQQNADGEVFLINIPTGSGKTLCSVKFALERAVQKAKKRIIYIIPYNSIIDQTADVFENLFNADVEILRHQSSFSYENKEDYTEDFRQAAKSAIENWDAPFIITTVVQFFETIYSNKRGKLRKLHNMADSILIFDEAHMLPVNYLQPCLRAVSYITRYLNSEAVFLTATMPDYEKLMHAYALPDTRVLNLVKDVSRFDDFKKCSYKYLGEISYEKILQEALKYPSSLIIVNKRNTARSLYQMYHGKKYHLSTYMTAYDRKRVIKAIKEEIELLEHDFPDGKNVPENRKIIVFSTSLIEAGVDLDMYAVFRELAGLDNILQAGGRCNREGKRQDASTYIFEIDDVEKKSVQGIKENITKGLIKKYSDISCMQSIEEYYDRLLFIKRDEIQKNKITDFGANECHDIRNIPFKKYAEHFEMIDARTVSLVVARDDKSKSIISSLKYSGMASMRELQIYMCSVYQNELDNLIRQHVAEDFGTGIYCLTNQDYYDENIGITFEAKDYYI